jgi:general secretion pathway protein D
LPEGERAIAKPIKAQKAMMEGFCSVEVSQFWGTYMLLRFSTRSGAISSWRFEKLLPGVLATIAGLAGAAGWATAQQPTTPMPMPTKPGAVAPITVPSAPPEKLVTVNFKDTKWTEVLDWFATESGLLPILTVKPTGSVTIQPAKEHKFTMAEVVDLLNEAMQQQKFILIRRHVTFFIHPSDEPLDSSMVPRVEIPELSKRGKTEIVQVLIPLAALNVEDVSQEMTKLLTPFGKITSLVRTNTLIMMDTAGNIKRIYDLIQDIEKKTIDGDTYTHQCRFKKAEDVATVLKTHLSEATVTLAGSGGSAPGGYPMYPGGVDPRSMYPYPGAGGPGGGSPGGPGGVPGMENSRGGSDGGRGRGGNVTPVTRKAVTISVEAKENRITVVGPPDKVQMAKKLIEDTDKGDKPYVFGEPVFRKHPVPQGTADSIAKTLQADDPSIKILSLPASNEILVLATDEEHKVVQGKIGFKPEQAKTTTIVIPLVFSDPTDLVTKLTVNFPSANGGPVIQARLVPEPGIIVKGTMNQIKEIQDWVFASEGITPQQQSGSSTGNNQRSFSIQNGYAPLVAEKLARTLSSLRSNPVEIKDKNDQGKEAPPVNPVPVNPGAGPAPNSPMPMPPGGQSSATPRGDVVYINSQIVDPNQPNQPKSDKKPVTIEVNGNRLTITSDDPEALTLLGELARQYQPGLPPQENLFKVIKLRNVSAEDAAKTITEIFNGPQQSQQQQRPGGGLGGGGGFNPFLGAFGGGGFGGGGGGGGNQQVPAGVNPNRVRVVAEKASNSLIIVKASPIDQLIIEKLLSASIDSGNVDDAIRVQKWVIQIEYASATEVATRVRNLFRNLATPTQSAPAMPMPFVPPQAQVNIKQPQLTVDADDRTNKLLLFCDRGTYEDIYRLVKDDLDVADVSNPQVVKIVSLKGLDPAMVQQAINAFQGIGQGTGGFGNGFGNRGGFGGNGFGGNGFGGGGAGFGGGGPGFGGGGAGFGGGGPGFGGGGPGFGGGGPGFGAGAAGLGGMRGPGGGAVAPGGGVGPGGGGPRGGAAPGGARGGGRQANAGVINAGGMEGPLNFDYRGMDAPLALVSMIYDPMIEGTESRKNTTFPMPANSKEIVPIAAQFQLPIAAQPFPPMPQPTRPGPVVPPQAPTPPSGPGNTAPRGFLTVSQLPGLDALVIRAENEKDLEIILAMLENLREASRGAQPRIQVLQLENIDCNYAADFLTQLFSRVIIMGPGGAYAAQSTAGTVAPGGFGAAAQQSLNRGFFFLAMPQQNAMLVVAPEARFEDVLREIRRIDVPDSDMTKPKAFPLKNASAQVVATQLQTFFNTRFPSLAQAKTQFRVTYNSGSNTVWVQGSRNDLAAAEDLIIQWDTMESIAINDVRIFPILQADAQGLAQVLTNALSVHVVSPLQQTTFAGPIVQQAGGTSTLTGTAAPGALGGALGAAPALGAAAPGGALGGAPLGGAALGAAGATQNVQVTSTTATVGQSLEGGLITKTSSIRFFYGKDGEQQVVTGLLADVHLVPNQRTNAIIVSAPTKTMTLIEKMIQSLDTVAAAKAFVQIYTLKNADATLTATLLRNLFTGSTTTGGAGGVGGTGGGGATGLGGATGTTGSTASNATRPLLVTQGTGDISPGATLIGLTIAVDDRTNSLVVSGAQNDLDTIHAIIQKLEASDTPDRYYDVFKLKNAAAADVYTALNTFLANSLAVLTGSPNFNSTFIQLQKNVVIVAEPVSNTLLISATPFYFMEMKRIIERIDAQPPQVVIQVLIAEVDLTNDEEFGIEVGVQSPVLFSRSLLAAQSTANTTTGATNIAVPGFNFNNVNTPLGNSSVISPGTVGYQGLSNLGVGQVSASQGVGGFVFQASSQSLNLLIRALQAQNRIEILSRPQVTVADNQTGFIQVGANYPYLSASILTAVGTASQSVLYYPIGVTMRVTPRVNQDGKVLMRVEPQVATVSPNPVSLGNGILAPAFNIETVQTTVLASSGETIVLGGMISKSDNRTENGLPFLKDIPYFGALFRYRTHLVTRQEVLIIMTPHIVRSEVDDARILAEESARLPSCFQDWARIHGHGMEVIGPATLGARVVPTNPMAPGGGFFNATPSTSPPYLSNDLKSEFSSGGTNNGNTAQQGNVQQQQQYTTAPNGQPIYTPNTAQVPSGQPMYTPGGVQAPVTQPNYNPAPVQSPSGQSPYLSGSAPSGQSPYISGPVQLPGGQPVYGPGVGQGPVGLPLNNPGALQTPGGQQTNIQSGLPQITYPPVSGPMPSVGQSGVPMQPGSIPGVPVPPGSNITPLSGVQGRMDSQPMTQQAQQASTSSFATQQPAVSGSSTMIGPNYRMEMPNGQSITGPGTNSTRYPDLPPTVWDSQFMQMQTQPSQKPPATGTFMNGQSITGPGTNSTRYPDLPPTVWDSQFMQMQTQPSQKPPATGAFMNGTSGYGTSGNGMPAVPVSQNH